MSVSHTHQHALVCGLEATGHCLDGHQIACCLLFTEENLTLCNGDRTSNDNLAVNLALSVNSLLRGSSPSLLVMQIKSAACALPTNTFT